MAQVQKAQVKFYFYFNSIFMNRFLLDSVSLIIAILIGLSTNAQQTTFKKKQLLGKWQFSQILDDQGAQFFFMPSVGGGDPSPESCTQMELFHGKASLTIGEGHYPIKWKLKRGILRIEVKGTAPCEYQVKSVDYGKLILVMPITGKDGNQRKLFLHYLRA